jgi:hypothetical protein
MGAYLSTEKETITISGYVYADSLDEAKRIISQEWGPGFELGHCIEKEYPIIII